MDRTTVVTKITEIFRDIFDNPELIITDSTCAKDIDDWDSMAQIMLLSSIEDCFDIVFAVNEVENLENAGGIIDLVVSKVKIKL